MPFTDADGVWYRVSPQHLEVAAKALETKPEVVALIKRHKEPGNQNDMNEVHGVGHEVADALDEDTVIELFLKSDWDSIESGMDSHDARMEFMRHVVGMNIAESMYQRVLNIQQ